MARIVAGVSGGVDSAVAAARLIDAGHDVTAVHLLLQPDAEPGSRTADDASRVAKRLGIAFEIWDMRDAFQRLVLDDFVAEYAAGRTPNPCLKCNRTIKFGELLARASDAGYDGVATGHYARLAPGADGVVELMRASDASKDQSYVLSVLGQDQLQRVFLPLGGSTKHEVRADAMARNLPVASKSESMDLCFIPDGDRVGWLHSRLGMRSGAIVDEAGAVLGHHDGTYRYTIGQRKGLNLKHPSPDGAPRFVVGLDPRQGLVIVGPHERLAVGMLRCGPAVWTSGEAPDRPLALAVQVRAHGEEYAATVAPASDGTVDIHLATPIMGVAPGQTAAFYDGPRVVGSATIGQCVHPAGWSSVQPPEQA